MSFSHRIPVCGISCIKSSNLLHHFSLVFISLPNLSSMEHGTTHASRIHSTFYYYGQTVSTALSHLANTVSLRYHNFFTTSKDKHLFISPDTPLLCLFPDSYKSNIWIYSSCLSITLITQHVLHMFWWSHVFFQVPIPARQHNVKM